MKLFEDFLLRFDRFIAQDKRFGLFIRHTDAGILFQYFLGGSPPFLVLDRPNHASQRALNFRSHHRHVIASRQNFTDQISRCLLDHFLNRIRLSA